MTTATRHVEYRHDELTFDGVLALADSKDEKRPTVLVFHGVEGRSDTQVEFAKSVTEWGYHGLAVDLFGQHATAADSERYQELMTAFLNDRGTLRERLLHVFDVARSVPEVDSDRLAAIGFCFGGLCALDLARTGAAVQGVASFHGILTAPSGTTNDEITAKVISFHGWDDPFAPPEDVTAFGREFSERGADWQVHAYGATMHAFMAPWADNPDAGIQYNKRSAQRAWASLKAFLDEALS